MKTSLNMKNMKTAITAMVLLCSMLLASHRSMASCNINLVDSIVPEDCYNNAQVFLKATGGTGSYQFRQGILGTWQNAIGIGGGYMAWYFPPAGVDTFYVKDSLGCTQSITAAITSFRATDTLTYANQGSNTYLFTAHTNATRPHFLWRDNGQYFNGNFGYDNFITRTLTAGAHTIISSIYDTATNCTVYDTIQLNTNLCTGHDSITFDVLSFWDYRFHANVTGLGHIGYRWYINGGAVGGSDPMYYTTYYGLVINKVVLYAYDSVTGCVAYDSIGAPCNIHDSITYTDLGSGLYHFSANATGTAHPAYSWRIGGVNGALTSTAANFNYQMTRGSYLTLYLQIQDSVTGCLFADSAFVSGPPCNITDSVSYQYIGVSSYTLTAHTQATRPYFQWRDNLGTMYSSTPGYNNSITLSLSSGPHTIISYVTDSVAYCGAVDTIIINVPYPPAGPDQTLCHRSVATMAATGTGTWTAVPSNPSATTITNSSSPTTTITGLNSSGQYLFVWHTTGLNDTVAVTVQAAVSYSILQTGTLCDINDSIYISPSFSGGAVAWYRNGSYVAGTQSNYSYYTPNRTSGTYTAIIIRGTGCDDTASIVLTCNTLYTNLTATICQGTPYTFRGQNLTASGVYRDTLNASTGYDSIITLTLTVNPSLNLNLTQSGSICTGNDTLTVTGAGSNTVTWRRNGVVVTPASTTYTPYTVAGGNGSGTAANQLRTPYGVALDAAGNIYVADQINNRIQKFPANSTSLTNGTTVAGGNGIGSGLNQLYRPYGVKLDAAGNIYVADGANNRVIKFPAGSTSATSGTIVAGGNGAGSGANQLSTPANVAFDAAGNMYVCDFDNNRVQKFPAGSSSATSGVTVASTGSSVGTLLNYPISIYIDGSNRLFVADQHNGWVLRYPAGSTSTTVGTVVANNINYPTDIALNSAGEIFVADYQGHIIRKFPANSTSTTASVTVAGGFGSGATQLHNPNRIALDAYGNMFVSDEYNNRIQKIQIAPGIQPNSYVATTTGTYLAIATNSSGCSDTAVAYVVCATTIYSNISASICQGSTYSFNGSILNTAGIYKDTLSAASGADSIITLTLTVNPTPSITISQSGSICSPGGDTLRVIGGTGSSISWIGNGTPIGGSSSFSTYTVAGGNGSGSGATQFKTPYGVQADAAGYIYVLDQGNNRIQKFPPGSTSITGGTTVVGGNGSGSGLNQFNRPYGFTIDAAGNIYVADSYNHRVRKFAAGSTSSSYGTIVAGGNGQGSGATQLNTPTDVAFDAAGNMFVADFANHRIQKFPAGSTSATSGVTAAGGNGVGGSGPTNLNLPIGVYIDAAGSLYVADQHNCRIQKFPAGSTSSTPGVTVAGLGNGVGNSASNALLYPNDMMIDAAGYLYVCDYHNNRVQRYPPNSTSGTNGVTVAGSGGYGGGTYQFRFNTRFYMDALGNMFISDEGNNRVQKYAVNTSASSFIATSAGVYTAIATNASGCSDTASVTLLPCLSDSVWPGDADHNGVDDNNDLLPIGLGYGLTGLTRPDQSIVWSAHYAQNWGMQFLNGTNGKHADCNGDGVIDANDTTAILLNFGFTHSKNEGSAQPWRSGIPGITLKYSRDTVAAGDTLMVSLILGDSSTTVSNLYGIAFTYHFDPIVVDSTTARFGFIPSFMGNNINSISIHKDFKTEGSVKAAIAGINHIGRNGYGEIARFISTITTGNINGKDLSYYQNISYISDINAVDRDGNPVPLNTGVSTNEVAYDATIGIHDIDYARVLIYPNPAKDAFIIQTSSQLAGTDYTLTDMTGRVMLSGKLAGEQTHVAVSDLASGIYMLHFAGQKQAYKITKN
jgi:sugar lactone lactonase YvrE